MTENTPLEYEEQCQFIEYLEILQQQGKVVLFTAIPNSTYTESWNQKRRNFYSGLRKGLPDLIIILKHPSLESKNIMVFIEMKRKKKSKTTPEQEHWIFELNKIDNVEAVICKGFEEAKKFIDTL